MIKLQYFNGLWWVECGEFISEQLAWTTLGDDDKNYRTINEYGSVLTDKSK
ncbi:hypothetical protein [Vibrio owensii]|uniref:hypothetical protein n=1 Tax=Vibrio owensii TaxID=696485 RepID=UPI0014054F80|nr:hypothetical protein [Vibrio owensii]